MRFEGPYATAANKYRPVRTNVLFVAEGPPKDIDRYFYFENVEHDDWLWIGLMKALYPSEWSQANAERQRKEYWLLKFQKNGLWLIDAIKAPISGSSRKRVGLIESAAPQLIEEIKQIAPHQIVLIKATVHEALFQALRDARLPVINKTSLPFPCASRQKEFHNGVRRLVDAGELRLHPTPIGRGISQPEHIIFWGAGATAALGTRTTDDQTQFIRRITGAGAWQAP